MDFVIRPMTDSDVGAVAELEKECFAVAWSEQSLSNELKNSMAHYYVATVSDKVVGYIGMWVVIDQAQIMNVAVTAQMRGKGIASALIDRVLQIALEKDATSITLEVRVSNEKAISLYKKSGFREISVRKGYYRDNREDALIMMREI